MNIQVLKDFFSSEKGVFGYLLPLIGVTVFVFLGRVTEQEWMEYSLYMAGIYTGGKAVQGGAAQIAGGNAARAELAELQEMILENDASADAALDERFPAAAADDKE